MSTLRPRSAATKQPSIKETNTTPTPTTNTDSDTSKAPPQRQPSMQQRATQTLTSTAANLANLLPTGTLLAFQILTPIFTNNGACDSATRSMTLILLVLLALSCFLASFTDSIKASDGQVYYGFTTFKGLWLFDYPDASGTGLPDLSKLRIRVIDGIHAVLSALVFGAVALRDKNVLQCLYPQPGQQTREVLNILPAGVGLICSLLFVVFPTSRHGIGYPVTPVHKRTEFRSISVASVAAGSGGREPRSTSSGSTGSQNDASSSGDTEPNSTTSGSTDSQNDAASNDMKSDGTSPGAIGSGTLDNYAAFGSGSREKSKRGIRRPSYLEDYILY